MASAPTSSAERTHQHRAQVRNGLVCAKADVPLHLIEELIAQGYLPEDRSEDPVAIGAALRERLADRGRGPVFKKRFGFVGS